MHLARGTVLSRGAHLPGEPDDGSGLQIVPAEDANRIERRELRRRRGIRQRRRQIEAFHYRPPVRLAQADNLRIVLGGLGKKILVGGHQIGETHAGSVGVSPRPQDVSLKVDGGGVVRSDRENMYFVAVAHFKARRAGGEPLGDRWSRPG